MGASLTGSGAGSLSVKLGHIEGWILDILAFCGDTAQTNILAAGRITNRLTQVEADYAGGTAEYGVVDGLYTTGLAYQSTVSAFASGTLAPLATATLLDMVNLDTPMINKSSVAEALGILSRELTAASATINASAPAVGAQTNLFSSPVGNPTFLWAATDAAGRTLQYVYPESILVTMTGDSQTGSTAGQEPWTAAGKNAAPSLLSINAFNATYYGSGASLSGTLIDPAISSTGSATGNLTVNGTFTTYSTTNYPDNWVFHTGVATTNFLNSTGTKVYYTAGGSLELLSAGGTKNELWQKLNTASSTSVGAGGSPYALVPSAINNVQYALFFAYALKTASPSNGTLTVRLCDSGGTTINDDQGTANTVAIDLTAVADTNWHVGSLTIRMPQALPTTVPYAISFAFTGTILDAANAVYLGAVGMTIMTQFYVGGPYVAGFAGSTLVNASGQKPDAWTFAVTNTMGKLQNAFWRFFNPPSLSAQTPGIIINAGGSPTIADSVVV